MADRRPIVIAAAFLASFDFLVARPADAQPTCTYTIVLTGHIGDLGSNTVLAFTAYGGRSQFRLIAPAGCPWTTETSASFVTTQPSGGFGSADVGFSLAANFTASSRTATIRVADQRFTVSQGRGMPIVDFNRDGFFDLLWHNRADGRFSTWLMTGTQTFRGVSFTTSQVPDTNWELVGSGDLNGDGHSDLVWRNKADGRISAWLMAGLQKYDAALLSIPQVSNLEWRVRAVADVNGDGRADIFWQHQTQGLVAVWLMNGFTVLDGSLVQAPVISDLNWRLVGVTATSLDDRITLYWQHDGDGRLARWDVLQMTLRGASLTGTVVHDTDWKIRAMGDLDRDGIAEYIWQHQVDGRVVVWWSGSYANTVDLGAVPDTNWQLVGPR
jgi:VCBS repeat protein